MGLVRSASGRAGCLPVARNSSLLIRGCAGSAVTGPGPLGGGRKSAPVETQPVPLSGAKSGGVLAAKAGASAAMAQAKAVNAMPVNRLDMSLPAATNSEVRLCRLGHVGFLVVVVLVRVL